MKKDCIQLHFGLYLCVNLPFKRCSLFLHSFILSFRPVRKRLVVVLCTKCVRSTEIVCECVRCYSVTFSTYLNWNLAIVAPFTSCVVPLLLFFFDWTPKKIAIHLSTLSRTIQIPIYVFHWHFVQLLIAHFSASDFFFPSSIQCVYCFGIKFFNILHSQEWTFHYNM